MPQACHPSGLKVEVGGSQAQAPPRLQNEFTVSVVNSVRPL